MRTPAAELLGSGHKNPTNITDRRRVCSPPFPHPFGGVSVGRSDEEEEEDDDDDDDEAAARAMPLGMERPARAIGPRHGRHRCCARCKCARDVGRRGVGHLGAMDDADGAWRRSCESDAAHMTDGRDRWRSRRDDGAAEQGRRARRLGNNDTSLTPT